MRSEINCIIRNQAYRNSQHYFEPFPSHHVAVHVPIRSARAADGGVNGLRAPLAAAAATVARRVPIRGHCGALRGAASVSLRRHALFSLQGGADSASLTQMERDEISGSSGAVPATSRAR